MATNSERGRSFARRDQLLKIQSQIQKLWDEEKIFEATSLSKPLEPGEKFFGNFQYHYINVFLHLDHAFSLSKLELLWLTTDFVVGMFSFLFLSIARGCLSRHQLIRFQYMYEVVNCIGLIFELQDKFLWKTHFHL
ncbi:hypothetical protein KSP40_PGU004284 [Platanthera guangdongensis]|uniref:Uncharacterized protein n=1 Tax=Platanthera guangdongensis TaxID=2320717 RepID=A0ABR2LXE9_9ASPA